MTTPSDTIWNIEPHTLAKHEILRRYLVAWFPILCRYNPKVVYIDGFCGPGRYLGGEPGSPIIALEEALKHNERLQTNDLVFLFFDERSDRIKHLKSELDSLVLPKNFSALPVTGDFEKNLRDLLDNLDKSGSQLAPTFAFIDPFGFKGLPLDLVCRLLKNQKTEVFITFMVDSINRFREHPDQKIRHNIVELFGTSEVLSITMSEGKRIHNLRMLYQAQLKKCAKFVRYFEMRDGNNRPIYYLFFATNHPLGLVKMKEAFWKVDSSSGFSFSDATNPDQLVLFDIDETGKLITDLKLHFSGKTLKVEEIRKYVENETPFLSKHMTTALKSLEQNQQISVDTIKSNGVKRRKNTYPNEAIISFGS